MAWNKTGIYWICQLLGWGGLIVVETVNYTFFIIGEFSWNYLISFGIISVSGIVVTHGLRWVLRQSNVFEQPPSRIILIGLGATFVSATLVGIGQHLPSMILSPEEFFSQMDAIQVFGIVMNLGRYTFMWNAIYFLIKIMRQQAEKEQRVLKIEAQARAAELQLLKNQINPHFLFNTLNTIKALSLTDVEKSRDAIVQLSEILRFTLYHTQKPVVMLREELEEVEKYLQLEKLRFGKRLDYSVEVTADAREVEVTPGALLTMVENAVKHGIGQQISGGSIRIAGWLESDLLRLEVTNPGEYQAQTSGIGLKYLQSRLELEYGDRARFSISEHEHLVTASVSLPLYAHSHPAD